MSFLIRADGSVSLEVLIIFYDDLVQLPDM